MSHVYLSRQLTPAAMAAAGSLGGPLAVHADPDRPPPREQLLDGVRGATALITLLTEWIDEEVLDAAGSQLSLHCPLTSATHHLIGAEEFAVMKPTAIRVNTAQGPIVDEAGQVTALKGGVIAAARLDVFEDEPRLHPDLRHLENVILLPHIGSAGQAMRDAMGTRAVDNVRAVLAGDPTRTPVVA